MRLFTTSIIFLLLLTSYNAVFAQRNIQLTGKVVDKELREPLVEVLVTIEGTGISTRTNESGEYSITITDNPEKVLLFSKLGFDKVKIGVDELLKLEKRGVISYNPELVFTNILPEFGAPITVFGSKQIHVEDFEFHEDNYILLTYKKTLKKESVVILTDEKQNILHSYTVPRQATKLFRDYQGNVNVLCVDRVYRVLVENELISLLPIDKNEFEQQLEPCVDTLNQVIYYSDYNPDFPAFTYKAYNPEDSTSINIRTLIDEELMREFRFEFYYLPPHEQKYIRDLAREMGVEPQVLAAYYTGFQNSMYYNPLYAPMFIVEDTVLIFDHYKDMLFKYDENNNAIDSIKISYHTDKETRKNWEEMLIKDVETDRIYGVFLRNGMCELRELNVKTGKVLSAFQLNYKWVDKIKIKGEYAYYIYRPHGSTQRKYLYKELIFIP